MRVYFSKTRDCGLFSHKPGIVGYSVINPGMRGFADLHPGMRVFADLHPGRRLGSLLWSSGRRLWSLLWSSVVVFCHFVRPPPWCRGKVTF